MSVFLRCVKEGTKLRVKILTHGYSNLANCQFPKDIRVDGREYEVPAADISLVETRGKFFYRVNKKNIKIVEGGIPTENVKNEFKDMKIYGDENLSECAICLSDDQSLVFVIFAPCGHYCCCDTCASKLQKCPMCRADVKRLVKKEELQ
jgi:hypothetical protein